MQKLSEKYNLSEMSSLHVVVVRGAIELLKRIQRINACSRARRWSMFLKAKYLQVTGIHVGHTWWIISDRGGNYYSQCRGTVMHTKFIMKSSFCRMLESAAACLKWVGVVQALVSSMVVASLLTIPWGD